MSNPSVDLLNQPVDVSHDFEGLENTFFQADSSPAFETASGTLRWVRRSLKVRMAFCQTIVGYEAGNQWEFPPEYSQDVDAPFRSRLSRRARCVCGSARGRTHCATSPH